MFKDYYAQSKTFAGREWVYRSSESPKIVAERYLVDTTTVDKSISDYKIMCFGGVPYYIVCDTGRFVDHRRNIFDTNWNDLCIESDCHCSDEPIPKPENLDEMLRVAQILSQDFPAVRVDLYSIQGKVIFGELTFFPWSGYVVYSPDSFDYTLGEKFVLPQRNN